MSVSKRLRYEVLRRDNFQCRYCGAAAPDAKLTVDHVTPTALGGSDDASNLVAACDPCNSGKSASSPDAPTVADVAQDALRWSKALQVAAKKMLDRLDERDGLCEEFADHWNSWGLGGHKFPLPATWKQSVGAFLSAGLPMAVLCDCVDLAMAVPKVKVDDRFRYMCGIAWRKVTELQISARSVIAASAVPKVDDDTHEDDGTAEFMELLAGHLSVDLGDFAQTSELAEEWRSNWGPSVLSFHQEALLMASTKGLMTLDNVYKSVRSRADRVLPNMDVMILPSDRLLAVSAIAVRLAQRLERAEWDDDSCEKPCPFANVKNVEAPF